MVGIKLSPHAVDDLSLDALSDNKLYTSLVVSIAITSLLFIERIIDVFLSATYLSKPQSESDLITYFEFPVELLLLILGKDFLMILYIIPYQQYDLLTPVLYSQDVLFTWCFIYNLVRLGNPIWTLPKVFVIAFMFLISDVVFTWMIMTDASLESFDIFSVSSQTFIAFSFLLLFVVIGQWIYYVWSMNKETTDILTYMKVVQASVFIIFFFIYMLVTWYVTFIVNVPHEWNSSFGVNYLTLWVYTMSGCTACVSVISGRVSKFGNIIFSNVSKILLRLPTSIN